jgi:hypothetical protein
MGWNVSRSVMLLSQMPFRVRMLDEPQTVHAALVILGLLCVAVLFVAAKSPLTRQEPSSPHHRGSAVIPVGRW